MQQIRSNKLPLPPFGKILLAYQSEKISLELPIYVFVGTGAFEECCRQKKLGVLATCIPIDKSFQNYEWPLHGQHVILWDTGGNSTCGLELLRYKLYITGAKSVVVCSEFCAIDPFTNSLTKEI